MNTKNFNKAFSAKNDYRENGCFLPLFKLYSEIMNAYRWETDEEADRFYNGTFEISFTDGNGNKTTLQDDVSPYTFEAITDMLESMAEDMQDCYDVSDWLVKLFEDVKAGNETFICK